MNAHYWKTSEPHADNSETMTDYLENEMDPSWTIVRVHGTYAKVMDDCGELYALDASGDGDFNHHIVEFKKLIQPPVFES